MQKSIYISFTIFLIMKVFLDVNQYVLVSSNHKVCFCHITSSNIRHVITLRAWQFFNLNDIMRAMTRFSHLTWYPLGKGVWLYKKNNEVKLVHYEKQLFFRFYKRGWYIYKSKVHSLINSFLRHDTYAEDNQFDARNEGQSSDHTRRRISSLQGRKRLPPWSSRNVSDEDEDQRTKSSTVSRRQNSNSRSHSKQRGRKHAMRNCNSIAESAEDGEVSSDSFDSYECGSEPSVTLHD